jgi:hypothetical protein
MSDIISTINKLTGLASLSPAPIDLIKNSETLLGLHFANDYHIYLEKYGAISFDNKELTGIVESKRLNVVDVTKKERLRNTIPEDMYVVEDTGIEGILILQNSKGEIFELQNHSQIKKIYDNLSAYLEAD